VLDRLWVGYKEKGGRNLRTRDDYFVYISVPEIGLTWGNEKLTEFGVPKMKRRVLVHNIRAKVLSVVVNAESYKKLEESGELKRMDDHGVVIIKSEDIINTPFPDITDNDSPWLVTPVALD